MRSLTISITVLAFLSLGTKGQAQTLSLDVHGGVSLPTGGMGNLDVNLNVGAGVSQFDVETYTTTAGESFSYADDSVFTVTGGASATYPLSRMAAILLRVQAYGVTTGEGGGRQQPGRIELEGTLWTFPVTLGVRWEPF